MPCVTLSKKDLLVVPAKELRRRAFHIHARDNGQYLAVVFVVLAPVGEFLANPLANLDVELVGNCDVPGVEQRMQVRAQQEPIRKKMWSFVGIRLDVCRIEDRQRPFPCDRATPRIGLRDQDSECALTEPCAGQGIRPETRGFGNAVFEEWPPVQTIGNGCPNSPTVIQCRVKRAPSYDVATPSLRNRDPL